MRHRLVYYGNPILRKYCEPIQEFTDEIRKIAQDLIEAMYAFNGCGIAAPQLGIPFRIFISALDGRDKDGYAILGKPEVYINPKLSMVSKEEDVKPEGCISIPGVYEDIQRPISITMEAYNEEGKLFVKNAQDWKARNILHENDHLNGVLIIDRVGKLRRRQLEPVLKRLKKKYNP